MPVNSPLPPAHLPSPSLAELGIALPPLPSHSPPSSMAMNSHSVMRSLNSAPLVPMSTVGYNAPLKRTKSSKDSRSPPPRSTTSPPAVRAYFPSKADDAPPTRHVNQPVPVGTQRPAGKAPWSSTHSVDSTATSDESSAPLTMKPLRQLGSSPPTRTTAFKKSSSTDTLAFSGSIHAQMTAFPIMRLPKLKTPSLRPKTAPSGALLQRSRSPSTNTLTHVKAANGSEGRLFVPSRPVPLSPINPPFPGGLVSSNHLSSPLVPLAVPQLSSKIPNFIATYSTVPSQTITAPKPPTGPKDATRQSFRTLRLVQASLGTPAVVPLSPSNPSQVQGYKLRGGGYVTDNLYVPCYVWHTPETWIFISSLGDKVKALETLQESLRVAQNAAMALFGAAARPQDPRLGVIEPNVVPSDGARSRGALEWLSALDGLLATLGQLELGRGKKLGLGEGGGGGGGGTGSVSRTKKMKDWSTRVARKSFGVASGKSSGALGVEYVEALGAVCAGVSMLDRHACALARLALHRPGGEERPTPEADAGLVEALAGEYRSLSPQQVGATRAALVRIAGAVGTVVVPFVLRDLGVLMESSLENNGDADWMGAML